MLAPPPTIAEQQRQTLPSRGVQSYAPTDHELTVLIPAYNEIGRLGSTLDQLEEFLDRSEIDYRILVIDDGSCDGTAELTYGRGRRLTTLRLGSHRGKGAAVRAGMLAATGAVVAFTDADLPYDLRSLADGFQWVRQGACDVVFGARDLAGAMSPASRRLFRRIATRLFRYLVSSLFSRDVIDTQCGLKVFSRGAALNIFSRTTIDGFAFDAEVVHLTERLAIPYRRIPVSLVNEYSSTLSLGRHALPMAIDVCKMWHRHRKSMTTAARDFMAASRQSSPRAA
jgi:dolichyl-phosphate beta-glucosyltransferase